jgi:hypothetical protein
VAYTAQDVINIALWQLGVLGPGESLSSAQNADLLKVLNVLIGRWAADSSLQLAANGFSFALQAGKANYSIGPTSADWVAPRPFRLDVCNLVVVQGGSNIRIDIPIITQIERFQATPSNMTAPWPTEVAYYPSFDVLGNGSLSFWPIPTQANPVELIYPSQISTFATLTTQMMMPDYYAEALASSAALRFAPMFGKVQSPAIVANAMNALQLIRNSNYQPIKRASLGNGSYWDYISGEMREAP